MLITTRGDNMNIKHEFDVKKERFNDPDSNNVYISWLIGKDSKAPNFYMRKIQILTNGYTPHHKHPYEHEVYITKGEGLLIQDSVSTPLKTGDSLLIDPNEIHQFRNISNEPFEFLCLIPK
jgi:quercetin dioxygenase-like cupin family protein